MKPVSCHLCRGMGVPGSACARTSSHTALSYLITPSSRLISAQLFERAVISQGFVLSPPYPPVVNLSRWQRRERGDPDVLEEQGEVGKGGCWRGGGDNWRRGQLGRGKPVPSRLVPAALLQGCGRGLLPAGPSADSRRCPEQPLTGPRLLPTSPDPLIFPTAQRRTLPLRSYLAAVQLLEGCPASVSIATPNPICLPVKLDFKARQAFKGICPFNRIALGESLSAELGT